MNDPKELERLMAMMVPQEQEIQIPLSPEIPIAPVEAPAALPEVVAAPEAPAAPIAQPDVQRAPAEEPTKPSEKDELITKYKAMLADLEKGPKKADKVTPSTGSMIADSLATLSNIVNNSQGEKQLFKQNASMNADVARQQAAGKAAGASKQKNLENQMKTLKALRDLQVGNKSKDGRKLFQTRTGIVEVDKDGKVNTLFEDPTTKAQLALSGRRTENTEKSRDLRERKETRLGSQFDKTYADKQELSDKQLESITALDETTNMLERIKDLKKKVNTGPYSQMMHEAGKYGTGQDEDQAALTQLVGAQLSDWIKSKSGTAVSEPEAKRLLATIPNASDDDKVFNRKLAEFEKTLNEMKDTKLANISKAQGRDVSALESKSQSKPTEVERSTPDGKIAIFDAKTKKFLRYKK